MLYYSYDNGKCTARGDNNDCSTNTNACENLLGMETPYNKRRVGVYIDEKN